MHQVIKHVKEDLPKDGSMMYDVFSLTRHLPEVLVTGIAQLRMLIDTKSLEGNGFKELSLDRTCARPGSPLMSEG